MQVSPTFPTELHQQTATIVRDYFSKIPEVDTILITNSCARGEAVPESDLDIAILIKPDTNPQRFIKIETDWLNYSEDHSTIANYKRSSKYALLHLDLISGKYAPTPIEHGGQADHFEIEIGNHICYSAPYGNEGNYFQELKQKWLPYYENDLRLQRFKMISDACRYDLEHIPLLTKRGLYVHAFDTLRTAVQKYLQLLFISNQTYPIAYNKWIWEQVVNWLKMPQVYTSLITILSLNNIESDEITHKAGKLDQLLEAIVPV